MKKHFLLLLFVFLYACISNEKQENTQKSEPENTPKITLIFAGDVMHHMPQMNAAYVPKTNSLDYTPCFQFIKPYIEKADLAFCNFETSLGGKPYSGYPKFSAPDELLFALKETGFDVMQIANNHVLDQGSKGLERAIQLMKDEGLLHIGAYINKDQRDTHHPLYVTIKDVKMAFLNYTYSTNGLITQKPNLVNLMDSIQIIHDISVAKENNSDLIIALMHWGWEYQQHSDTIQQKWADFLARKGVDLIVGSHPHVVQEVDFKEVNNKEVPVFYSLGNFISNQREKQRNGGILAKIEINAEKKYITTVSYIPFYVYKGYLDNLRQYFLIPTEDYLDTSLALDLPPRENFELADFHQVTTQRLSNVSIE